MSAFTLEELQKMDKNELITIIGNYISDQEIWTSQSVELEKQNDKKKAEIERLTEERDRYLDDRFAVCHALREMKKEYTELQKQVDELKQENSRLSLQLQFQIGEVDKKERVIEHLQKQADELKKENARLNNCVMSEEQVRKCCADIIQETMNKAVKDTAKEILDEVKSMFVYTNYNIDWIVNKLEKIAEKYGVEVE